MKITELTAGEEQLMNVLWNIEAGYMREIVEQFPEPKPHPNTISTFLKILVEKEFLKTAKKGRIFQYSVAIPFETYRKFKLENFIRTYCGNSATDLLHILLEENLVDIKDFENFTVKKPSATLRTKTEKADSPMSEFIEEITNPKGKKLKKEKKKKKKSAKDKKKDKSS